MSHEVQFLRTLAKIHFISLPLRRPKRFIFLGQGPVQGPFARATSLINRNVQGPQRDARANVCKGHIQGVSK